MNSSVSFPKDVPFCSIRSFNKMDVKPIKTAKIPVSIGKIVYVLVKEEASLVKQFRRVCLGFYLNTP